MSETTDNPSGQVLQAWLDNLRMETDMALEVGEPLSVPSTDMNVLLDLITDLEDAVVDFVEELHGDDWHHKRALELLGDRANRYLEFAEDAA